MIETKQNESDIPIVSYKRGIGKFNIKRFLKSRIFIILLCVLLIVSSFFWGMHVDYLTRFKTNPDYALLTSVIEYVNKYYYQDIDADTLIYYACKGIVDNLDPYSTIYVESTQSNSDAGYIGLEMSYGVNGEFRVMWVNDGSPADVAGIKIGDYITSVNGVNVEGDFVESFVALMGNKRVGDKVTLIVRSSDGNERLLELTAAASDDVYVRFVNDFTMLPGNISVPSNIGYIGFTTFNEKALSQFKDAVVAFKNANKTKLILDLRQNTGGDGEILRKIAKYLLEPKNEEEPYIMKLVRADGSVLDYVTSGEGEYIFNGVQNEQIVILVDNYTASASEALIGAMLLNGNSELVGSTTYGKGVGQATTPFPSETNNMFNLKLTIGRYYFAGDVSAYVKNADGYVDCIDGVGFTPKGENIVYSGRTNSLLEDPVMQRAITLISENG